MGERMRSDEYCGGFLGRRDFLKTAGVAGAAAVLGGWTTKGPAVASAQTNRPNVVYILADDLGYGDVSCLNPESKIPTANIDRVAREGIVFTDTHSGSAVCTPTRYGIMTGRYCWRSPLKAHVLEGHSPPLIKKDKLTVVSLLKSEGYRTACIGKWHLGLGWATTDGHSPRPNNLDYAERIDDGPTVLGFDYFFGIPASLDMTPYLYVENDHVVTPPTETIESSKAPAFFRGGPIAPGFKHADVLPSLTRKAVQCIDDHAAKSPDSPLFLYFPLSAPHAPIVPTPEHEGKSKAGVYGDFVCQVDWTVGQVLDALERNRMAENTLVIVTSDNGPAPVADFKKLKAMGHEPSYHFRGYKADIYEGGHRIPFVFRWPKHIKPGISCDHLTCLTDLMATLAELVGKKLPDNAGEDSVSMLPALLGTATKPARQDIVHHSANGFFSIREGTWKLEFCAGSGGWSEPTEPEAEKLGLPPVQLYDLNAEIGERQNVQDKHPEVVERLTKLLEKYVADGRSTPGARQQNEGKTSIWGPRAEKANPGKSGTAD